MFSYRDFKLRTVMKILAWYHWRSPAGILKILPCGSVPINVHISECPCQYFNCELSLMCFLEQTERASSWNDWHVYTVWVCLHWWLKTRVSAASTSCVYTTEGSHLACPRCLSFHERNLFTVLCSSTECLHSGTITHCNYYHPSFPPSIILPAIYLKNHIVFTS